MPLCPNFYFRCEKFQNKSWRGGSSLLFCLLSTGPGDAPPSAVGRDLCELQRSRLYGVEHLTLGTGSAGSGETGKTGEPLRGLHFRIYLSDSSKWTAHIVLLCKMEACENLGTSPTALYPNHRAFSAAVGWSCNLLGRDCFCSYNSVDT